MKSPFTAIVSLLAWIGSRGTRTVAILVIVSILLSRVGELLRPFLTEAVFVLLVIAFLRIETGRARALLRNPLPAIAATFWTSFLIPVAIGASCRVLNIDSHAPALYQGLVLQSLASPIMASPALAAIMGLDATLVLVSMIGSTLLLPLTVPFFHHLFLDGPLAISSSALSLRLFLIIACSMVTGLVIRHVLGAARIQKRNQEIDGINILIVFLFMVILMRGVGTSLFTQPHVLFGLLGAATCMFLFLFLSTFFTFLPFGRYTALSAAFMTSQRNMGLILAVTGDALAEVTWLYFALSQFPIYLSPHFLKLRETVSAREKILNCRDDGSPRS